MTQSENERCQQSEWKMFSTVQDFSRITDKMKVTNKPSNCRRKRRTTIQGDKSGIDTDATNEPDLFDLAVMTLQTVFMNFVTEGRMKAE